MSGKEMGKSFVSKKVSRLVPKLVRLSSEKLSPQNDGESSIDDNRKLHYIKLFKTFYFYYTQINVIVYMQAIIVLLID